MSNNIEIKEQSGLYKSGLSKENEAVVSAHFMHKINQDFSLKLYSPELFSNRALTVSLNLITTALIPSLIASSEQFVVQRASAAKIRARHNYKKYGLNTENEVGLAEIITEVMFDRQYLKGPKENCSRLILARKINELVQKRKPINLVLPALPYKSSSPLKSRGMMPDLAEVSFLLGLAELVKTIDIIYREEFITADKGMVKFIVISDGSRFNVFLNESSEIIVAYQNKLRWWINQLNISHFVEIFDYQEFIKKKLPKELALQKKEIRTKVLRQYTDVMMPIFDPCTMRQSISKAIELDPDPENCSEEGRFIALFKSLIYIIRYKILSNYAALHKVDYAVLYIELTRHIFEPYTALLEEELLNIEKFVRDPLMHNKLKRAELLEYLRQSMLKEAWQATINYIAEIRSDRDLPLDPVETCLPDHIRWTIHAKSGQLAILTTTTGDPIQPWHGAGVFMLTKNNKIKIYTQPVVLLEGGGAIPVVVTNSSENILNQQPLFYINPEISFSDIGGFLNELPKYITRNRKL